LFTHIVSIPKQKDFQRSLSKRLCLAGDEPLNWHPLISDFVLLARKLEGLGFIHHRGGVIILGDAFTQKEI